MTTLDRILDLLPPPYSVAQDSLLAGVVGAFALEFDAIQEDIDRLRRTHWIEQAYRLEDAAKLGDLCGIDPLPWETLESFRARLLPLIKAQLAGALGPDEIRGFVDGYLRNAQEALESTLVPGLSATKGTEEAYRHPPVREHFRPLVFREFPTRERRSAALASRDGQVPVLFRWTEANGGVEDSLARFRISGLAGRRTVVPLLANLSTGEMILFADRLVAGAELEIRPGEGDDPRRATALLDGVDATDRLHSLSGFTLGAPFDPSQYDPEPRLPSLPRGESEWLFLSVGLYDVRGLDNFFFALADEELREGRFDETRFDRSLFPSEARARVEMAWTEREPASFEVEVPRWIVIEPPGAAPDHRPHLLVAQALEHALSSLHAAGVRTSLRFTPFVERQEQRARHSLPWIWVDPVDGSAGTGDTLELGFHFGETGFGHGRFE